MSIKILKCNCINEFQDKTYGKGLRVHNPAGKANTKDFGSKHICTVCKDVKK